MRSSLRAIHVFSMTIAMLRIASNAPAATVTVTFINAQVSTTSNFAAGTTTAISPTPVGNGFMVQSTLETWKPFFRFGIQIQVSGNPNPEYGSAWDSAAQAAYGTPPMPQTLGVQCIGIRVNSSDAAGGALAPFVNTGPNAGKTMVTFDNSLIWTGPEDLGDVTGGIAGSPSSIFRGQSPLFDVRQAVLVSTLSTFSTASTFFVSLPYASSGASSVVLTPTVLLSDTNLWTRTAAGVVDGSGNIISDAAFGARGLDANDTIVYVVPEPASTALLALFGLIMLVRRRRAD